MSIFMSRAAFFASVLFILAITIGSAPAQDRRQNAPGKFDFYVLTLSWSPSFCEASAERGNNGAEQREQCNDRPSKVGHEPRVPGIRLRIPRLRTGHAAGYQRRSVVYTDTLTARLAV